MPYVCPPIAPASVPKRPLSGIVLGAALLALASACSQSQTPADAAAAAAAAPAGNAGARSGGTEPVSIFYRDPKDLAVCPCSERPVLDAFAVGS